MIKSERAKNYPVEFVSMFREYDIRGHVSDVELNPENVGRIVSAYAKFLLARGMKLFDGEDANTMTVRIEGMPELGTPETEE